MVTYRGVTDRGVPCPSLRRLFGPTCTALLALALLGGATALPAQALPGACPQNEAIRVEQHATFLPDCRAYEMVSPLDKNGGDILGIKGFSSGGVVQAAADGEAVTYLSGASFADPQGAAAGQYLSTRHGSQGWRTQNITTPSLAGKYGSAGTGAPYKAFSSDLSRGLLLNGETTCEGTIENPPLPSEPPAPFGYQNFYLRSSADGTLTPLLTFEPSIPSKEFCMGFDSASPDLKHVVVQSDGALTEGATPGDRNLFEWAEGTWQAVNVLPNATAGETALGAQLGSGQGETNTVSADGSRVFWSYGDGSAQALYVRIGGTETVRIDAPEGGPGIGPQENPHPEFETASVNGARAYFTSHSPLTSDANTGPPCGLFCKRSGTDLYRFDLEAPEGKRLTDLTPDATDPNGAEVRGVSGASADGSYVYFVAAAVLAGANREGHSPAPGSDNLYLWREDPATDAATTTFVATLSGADASDWSPEILQRPTRVAPAGQLVFVSAAGLTGYDNRDAASGQPDQEVYLYDPELARLACASCNPSGARPLGPSSIPAGTPFENVQNGVYQSRVLSEDGHRVFLDSSDALVPRDTNAHQDVYEYAGGNLALISAGTSSKASEFLDAAADGSDVLFLTRSQLVGADTDHLVDLYDARVGGGAAEPSPQPPCAGEACKAPAQQPPASEAPASATFSSPPNPKPPHKHKRHHAKRHHRRAAERNRGGAQ